MYDILAPIFGSNSFLVRVCHKNYLKICVTFNLVWINFEIRLYYYIVKHIITIYKKKILNLWLLYVLYYLELVPLQQCVQFEK